MIFIDDFWLLVQNDDPVGGFTLWDTTNPTAPRMWLLQDPVPPYPGVLRKNLLEISSSPGATGVFRTDSSRRVLAISGRVTSGGVGNRRCYLTFIIRSSALTNHTLGVREGGTVEWEKWKEGVVIVERSPRFLASVQVEGSRVFILGDRGAPKGQADFIIYDFSPGARKGQRNLSYTSQQITLTGTPSILRPQTSWGVSGDAVFRLDVRHLNSSRTCPVSRLTVGISGSPGNIVAPHCHCLVHLNLHQTTGMGFGSSARLHCYKYKRTFPDALLLLLLLAMIETRKFGQCLYPKLRVKRDSTN
jgi:hypothetical protein